MTVTPSATSRPTVGPYSGLPPLIASADIALRAGALDPAAYEPGDPVPNEGRAGEDYDMLAHGLPELTDGGLGIGGLAEDPEDEKYLYVPDGAVLDVETFTASAEGVWTQEATGSFDNLFAKIDGPLGGGGNGWQLAYFPPFGGTLALAAHGGFVQGAELAAAVPSPPAPLTIGQRYLATLRIDRPGNAMDVFLNTGKIATTTLTGLTSVRAEHEWIFGRGEHESRWRAGFFWSGTALTDDEITDVLPTELGVT